MNQPDNGFVDGFWSLTKLFLLLVIIFSGIYSWYAVNSVGMFVYIVVFLLEGRLPEKWRLVKSNGWVICCALFFFIHLIWFCFDQHTISNIAVLEKKIVYLTLPFALLSDPEFVSRSRNFLMFGCVAAVLSASLYCLFRSILSYYQLHDARVFFYHNLVGAIQQNAIYFSAFILFALIFLVNSYKALNIPRLILIPSFFFLLVFLFLLSSKLLICAGMIIIGTELLLKNRGAAAAWINRMIVFALILVTILILYVDNPVGRRFREIAYRNWALAEKDKLSRDTYLDGFQFRILQWRLTYQILNEKGVWWTGVGPNNARKELDKKYDSMDMYVGFKGYNCHNQYLQTLLQSGIIGLLLLISILFYLIKYASLQDDHTLMDLAILLVLLFMSESVLERQYGTLLFLILPAINFVRTKQKTPD